jgi:hypothetical protein
MELGQAPPVGGFAPLDAPGQAGTQASLIPLWDSWLDIGGDTPKDIS